MAAGVVYTARSPPPILRELVACAWTLTCTHALPAHRVLPDGCMDVVLVGARGAADRRTGDEGLRQPDGAR